jgi:putative transposase
MRKTFKYRIYANKETIAKAENWLNLCRNLYNCALEQRIDVYKRQRKTISGYTQMLELPEIKIGFFEYKMVGSQVLQQCLARLDNAYKAFFRRRINHEGRGGLPRFKGRDRYDSFTLKETGWKLEARFLSIRNVGRFKMKLSRPIQGDIKTITIHKSKTNHWYACFSCDNVIEKKLTQSDKSIGIDVGIKSFITDSNGNKIENPKFLKKKLKELRVRQRALAKAKRNSNRRKKTKLKLSKCYEKIANQRKDFHYKLANQYINEYGIITVEHLNIRGLVRNHKLARDISDCAWGQFIEILKFKAEEAGRQVIEVNPRNTSKRCSECGEVNATLKLSDREWTCLKCGAIHDRDINASMNIKRLGQSHQAQTKEDALCVAWKSHLL